ncbi:hypothetical protein KIW84_062648 [Lathyrus oleraceus]|uniref:Reverse transcriptase domain-containing protein n=1 Tax=Pisum sativum TaxID=3888 RepID=A0A9D4W6E3_PEA|nr:hypothetical protein KIW84_062648 [Pisum sativum]
MARISCKSGLPINQAEDGSEGVYELPTELARLLEHEKKEINMTGIDTNIVDHLPLKPECPPVKQKLRRTRPNMTLKIFLKKYGKVRMCVDYRELNKASPKDDFHLPHIDILVDNTTQFSVFSFMDGFSGYNKIKMSPDNMEKTTFITPWGTYCYKVMSLA